MFERFGTVGFTRHTKVADFVARLERGELTASRCGACGELSLPPRADCPACRSAEFTLEPVRPRGKVICTTTIHALPAGFEGSPPIVLAVVELEQAGRLLVPLATGGAASSCRALAAAARTASAGEESGGDAGAAPAACGTEVRIVPRVTGEGEDRRVVLRAEPIEPGGRGASDD